MCLLGMCSTLGKCLLDRCLLDRYSKYVQYKSDTPS